LVSEGQKRVRRAFGELYDKGVLSDILLMLNEESNRQTTRVEAGVLELLDAGLTLNINILTQLSGN